MGASFLAFGVATVDLYMLIAANLGLFVNYGLMVVDDGALRQLAELLALAALSGVCYVAFALCDRTLLRRLTEAPLRGLSR
jgi:hypothetical protein